MRGEPRKTRIDGESYDDVKCRRFAIDPQVATPREEATASDHSSRCLRAQDAAIDLVAQLLQASGQVVETTLEVRSSAAGGRIVFARRTSSARSGNLVDRAGGGPSDSRARPGPSSSAGPPGAAGHRDDGDADRRGLPTARRRTVIVGTARAGAGDRPRLAGRGDGAGRRDLAGHRGAAAE